MPLLFAHLVESNSEPQDPIVPAEVVQTLVLSLTQSSKKGFGST